MIKINIFRGDVTDISAELYSLRVDCLSHEMEVNETVNVPRCGHITGNLGSGWALNTGVIIWRNRPGTRAFAADWNRYMEHNELHEQGVDDQLSFNTLMNSRDLNRRTKSYPLRRVVNDSRVFYAAPNDAVKLMVLPSAVFAGMRPHISTSGFFLKTNSRLGHPEN